MPTLSRQTRRSKIFPATQITANTWPFFRIDNEGGSAPKEMTGQSNQDSKVTWRSETALPHGILLQKIILHFAWAKPMSWSQKVDIGHHINLIAAHFMERGLSTSVLMYDPRNQDPRFTQAQGYLRTQATSPHSRVPLRKNYFHPLQSYNNSISLWYNILPSGTNC